MNFRTVHRKVALVAMPFLAVSAATGLTYRVGRNWFGMSDETGAVIRAVHAGKYLGDALSPLYVLLVGLCLIGLVGSGATMIRRRRAATSRPPVRNSRWLHRTVAIVLALPLLATALTGIGFWLTQSWFGWSKEQAQWLLDIHQGTRFFGKGPRVYYVLFLGVGLLALLGSGGKMLGFFRSSRPAR
jgi:uncharacterized iron-regulated membrane protein